MELQTITQIPMDADVETITQTLQDQLADTKVKSTLRILGYNVPYRFLRPWINTSDDKEMLQRSQTLENDCLYSLHKEKDQFFILLNPMWNTYLHHHYNILADFTYWNLTLFLQAKNPQLPNLFHSRKRHSLSPDQEQPTAENTDCPFCQLSTQAEIICETATCLAFYDRFPVSPGHALIIPKRHVASYFDLTDREREAMNIMLQFVKKEVENRYHPDGYNIGINVNEAAGQSIFHVHMHLIPRYEGDVANPRGGVRGVIPDKQNYPKEEER